MDKKVVVGTTGNEIDPRGVDHPAHYNVHPSGVEAIEAVRWMNFNVGSAWKYMQRLGEKPEVGMTLPEAEAKDLDKIVWYLRDEQKFVAPLPKRFTPAIGKIAMARIMNAEPRLLVQQFYAALEQYTTEADVNSLDAAIQYAQAMRGRYPS